MCRICRNGWTARMSPRKRRSPSGGGYRRSRRGKLEYPRSADSHYNAGRHDSGRRRSRRNAGRRAGRRETRSLSLSPVLSPLPSVSSASPRSRRMPSPLKSAKKGLSHEAAVPFFWRNGCKRVLTPPPLNSPAPAKAGFRTCRRYLRQGAKSSLWLVEGAARGEISPSRSHCVKVR